MKPLRIDFGTARARAPAWSVLLFIMSVLVLGAALWRLGTAQARLAAADHAVQEAEAAQARTTALRPSPVVQTLPPRQVLAINRAVHGLNLPWGALFGMIESNRTANVALLAIEPDGEKRVVRIVAEAASAADMLAYVGKVSAQQGVKGSATLVKHERVQQDPDQLPYRFEILLPWEAQP